MEPTLRKTYVNLILTSVRGLIVSGRRMSGRVNSRWANKMNRKRVKKCIQSDSRLETPEELQLHHNHEKFLFLTVLLLFAQCKMYYWWLVTWLDLTWLDWLHSVSPNIKWSQTISRCRNTVHMGTISTFSSTPYLALGVVTDSKLSFHLQTVHPRGGSNLPLICCFWVPAHATALWFRYCITTKGAFLIILVWRLTEKPHKSMFSASQFIFRFLPLAKIIERMENVQNRAFGHSDEGQENARACFPQLSSKVWSTTTCRNSSRVNCMNCMSGSRDGI
jgi:hypothetical protein